MVNHNPTLMTQEQLHMATQTEILRAIYELLVASTSLFFAVLFFYGLYKFAVWFFPKWYYKKDAL